MAELVQRIRDNNFDVKYRLHQLNNSSDLSSEDISELYDQLNMSRTYLEKLGIQVDDKLVDADVRYKEMSERVNNLLGQLETGNAKPKGLSNLEAKKLNQPDTNTAEPNRAVDSTESKTEKEPTEESKGINLQRPSLPSTKPPDSEQSLPNGQKGIEADSAVGSPDMKNSDENDAATNVKDDNENMELNGHDDHDKTAVLSKSSSDNRIGNDNDAGRDINPREENSNDQNFKPSGENNQGNRKKDQDRENEVKESAPSSPKSNWSLSLESELSIPQYPPTLNDDMESPLSKRNHSPKAESSLQSFALSYLTPPKQPTLNVQSPHPQRVSRYLDNNAYSLHSLYQNIDSMDKSDIKKALGTIMAQPSVDTLHKRIKDLEEQNNCLEQDKADLEAQLMDTTISRERLKSQVLGVLKLSNDRLRGQREDLKFMRKYDALLLEHYRRTSIRRRHILDYFLHSEEESQQTIIQPSRPTLRATALSVIFAIRLRNQHQDYKRRLQKLQNL
uniref:ARAD1C17908p n=1 Tax=Blastobotrys adeninivorans TaxID=409370 RepID=A0A060T733_BLAAD